MGLMGRYILRQVLTVFALVLATLTGVLWLTQALERAGLLTKDGQTILLFLQFTLLSVPGMLIVIAPIAFFIACVYVLNRLNNDSELIVISASGASRWAVITPIISGALIVTTVMYAASLHYVPWSWRQLRVLITEVRSDVLSDIISPGGFQTPERGLVFHVRDRAPDGVLLGLLVHDEREPGTTFTYLAEAARLVEDDGAAVLVMQNGSVQQIDWQAGDAAPGSTKGPITETDINIVDFDRYVFDLSQFADDRELTLPSLKPRERFMDELLYPPPDDPRWIQAPGKFRSELNERLAGPLYPIVFGAIALAAVGFARSNREKRLIGVVLAVLCVLITRLLGFGMTNLSTSTAAASSLVFAVPVLTFLIALSIAAGWLRTNRALASLSGMVDRLADVGLSWIRSARPMVRRRGRA